MFKTSTLLFFTFVAVVSAVPLQRRVAQNTIAAVKPWEAACIANGGDGNTPGQVCNSLAVAAAGALLAQTSNCAQQDAAEKMMKLSKALGNEDMVKLVQVYAQQPKNSPENVFMPYCDKLSEFEELQGLYPCQWGGARPVANMTLPAGVSEINPLGSCPSHSEGPVPPGAQLLDIISTQPKTPEGTPKGAAPSPGSKSPQCPVVDPEEGDGTDTEGDGVEGDGEDTEGEGDDTTDQNPGEDEDTEQTEGSDELTQAKRFFRRRAVMRR